MRKVLFVAFMVMAFMALGSMVAFACGGDKVTKAGAKSGYSCSASKTTAAKLASSKTVDAKLATSKSACSASKANATTASSKTAGYKAACAAKASLANAKGEFCSPENIAKCVAHSNVMHAELCGADATCKLTAMSITGMTCGGCEGSIKTALMAAEGVNNVIEVCYKAGFAVVCTNKADFNSEVLVKTVAAKGFESEIIPAVAVITTDSKTEKAASTTDKKGASN